MGLCKCPKKRVTTQFCYEHLVNVCTSCVVTNHPKCIVQSYLKWLDDSEYNPICVFCKTSLTSDECIRLLCFDVFHWSCLDEYARGLPSTTAPAGYTCPLCQDPIIPESNVISPLADVIRERISSVNWARIGLGLPLLSNEERVPKPEKNNKSAKDVILVMNEGSNNFSRTDYSVNVPRRVYHNLDPVEVSPNHGFNLDSSKDDDDGKKYVRKGIFRMVWRKIDGMRKCNKFFYMKLKRPAVLLCLILMLILIYTVFGRNSVD